MEKGFSVGTMGVKEQNLQKTDFSGFIQLPILG
jgi:hypothetical protein